jgi:hypothetical protein
MSFTTEKEYSDNWKTLGTILMYKPPQFQFSSSVIITELENCLLDHITPNKLYDTRNKHDINYNTELIEQLTKDSTDKSIVILSNQINQNKLNIDMIKKKLEELLSKTKLHILALFALTPNKFSKPHTGMYKLLDAYYKQHGSSIRRAVVVSNDGGLIIEKEKRNSVETKVAFRDTDRAFAHNISAEYFTIDEYLDENDKNGMRVTDQNFGKKVKFSWDGNIISPEVRLEYVKEITKMEPVNIFAELGKFKNVDSYVIMILGAPRCGKTKLTKEIIRKWRDSKFGESNEVRALSRNEFSKGRLFNTFRKYVDDRIHIILDGSCNNPDERKPFLEYIADRNIAVLYIEVNVGFEMARVFNHTCVENATSDKVMLYKNRDYYIFKSMYKRPKPDEYNKATFIVYYPTIEVSSSLMYRY